MRGNQPFTLEEVIKELRDLLPVHDVWVECCLQKLEVLAQQVLHSCSRCGSPIEFVEDEGVWRHSGKPWEPEYAAQQFCDRYGYPVVPSIAPSGAEGA